MYTCEKNKTVFYEVMAWGGFFAGLGNTVGTLIPYTCPHCGETRRISDYGGNIVDGAECPSCGNDPTNRATGNKHTSTS